MEELSTFPDCLRESLKSEDYSVVISALLRCLRVDPESKGVLTEVEESLVNCAYSMIADDLDDLRQGVDKHGNKSAAANWSALLGALTLLCYTEYEKQ